MMLTRRRTIGMLAVSALAVVAGACQSSSGTAPAAAAAPAATKLFLYGDMVFGTKNLPKADAPTKSCVLNNRYPRNSEIVWRARVFDPKTGDLMDDKALSSVQVELANGKTIDMSYAAHPKDPPGEYFWGGSWVVPKDQAPGTLKYKIVAKAADGRSGEFEPPAVSTSLLTITEDVLEDAPAK